MVLRLHRYDDDEPLIERGAGSFQRQSRNAWLYDEQDRHLHHMTMQDPPQSIREAIHHSALKLTREEGSRIGYLVREEDARGQAPTPYTSTLQYFVQKAASEQIDIPLETEMAKQRQRGVDAPEPLGNEHEEVALYTLTGGPVDIALVYSKPAPMDMEAYTRLSGEQRSAYIESIPRRKHLLTGSFVMTEDPRFKQSVLSLVKQVKKARGTVPANALTDGKVFRRILLGESNGRKSLEDAMKQEGRNKNPLPYMKADVLLSPCGAIPHPKYFPDATFTLDEWDLDQEEAGKRAAEVFFDVLQFKMKHGDPNFGNHLRALDLQYPESVVAHKKSRRKAA